MKKISYNYEIFSSLPIPTSLPNTKISKKKKQHVSSIFINKFCYFKVRKFLPILFFFLFPRLYKNTHAQLFNTVLFSSYKLACRSNKNNNNKKKLILETRKKSSKFKKIYTFWLTLLKLKRENCMRVCVCVLFVRLKQWEIV